MHTLQDLHTNQVSSNKAKEILNYIIYNCCHQNDNDDEDLKKSKIIKMIDDLYNSLFCADATLDEQLDSVDYNCSGFSAYSDKIQEENEIYRERLYNYENPKVFHKPYYIFQILACIYYESISMQKQLLNIHSMFYEDFFEKLYNLDEYEFIIMILYHTLLKNKTVNYFRLF